MRPHPSWKHERMSRLTLTSRQISRRGPLLHPSWQQECRQFMPDTDANRRSDLDLYHCQGHLLAMNNESNLNDVVSNTALAPIKGAPAFQKFLFWPLDCHIKNA